MAEAFNCDHVPTPTGRDEGALNAKPADVLAVQPLRVPMARCPALNQAADNVISGGAEQGGAVVTAAVPPRSMGIGVGQGIAAAIGHA